MSEDSWLLFQLTLDRINNCELTLTIVRTVKDPIRTIKATIVPENGYYFLDHSYLCLAF